MWLLIDDMRNLNCDAIARNAKAAKVLLKCNCWECVCFDFDLGLGESGYDVLRWMLDMKIYPLQIQLVTSNPVGKKAMEECLKDNGYINAIDNYMWKKEKYENSTRA